MCKGAWETKRPLLSAGWKAAPRITSRWGRITRREQGLPAPPSTSPPKNRVSVRSNQDLCARWSAFVWGEWCVFLPLSTQPATGQSDVEHIELQDYIELGAGQSPGEWVRGHRLQSKHPVARLYQEIVFVAAASVLWLSTRLAPFVIRCSTKRIATVAPTSWKPTPPLWSSPCPPTRIISSR